MVCDGSMCYMEGDAPEGEQGWGDDWDGVLDVESDWPMDNEEGDDD